MDQTHKVAGWIVLIRPVSAADVSTSAKHLTAKRSSSNLKRSRVMHDLRWAAAGRAPSAAERQ